MFLIISFNVIGTTVLCLIIIYLLQTTVKNMTLYGELEDHDRCVNAGEFNSTIDLLVSGSDNRQVMCWNWASKTKLFAYPSGHSETIYQTKFMPFTDDSKIVTSAGDGEVKNLCKCASNIHSLLFDLIYFQ